MYMTIEAGGSKCYKQGKIMNMCISEKWMLFSLPMASLELVPLVIIPYLETWPMLNGLLSHFCKLFLFSFQF